ncbi:hypothetical protein GJ744_010033 [Endocarpon pusillum]|uniref:Uncharacterized protein n=1 Tax=Endocarpon pusillum TaxID=364733 RepID=A0A8H7AGW1_9EURO|nr:hypothetical protein GJ744_010033 [Endocarpon pusillum]
MHFAALGYISTILTILHLLGDPIDSMWSLLTKLEVSRRCHVWVTRTATRRVPTKAVAIILAAMEELDGSGGEINVLTGSIQPYLHPNIDQDIFDDACKEAASELADSKVDESIRTYLAILGYLFSLSAAFVDAVDNGSEKPGNRIAFAMLFSWLIPAVLLSAATGRFCSSGSCQRIIERFQWSLNHPHRDCDSGSEMIRKPQPASCCSRCISTIQINFHAARPWAGPIYTYRPEKQIFATGSGSDRRPLLLLLFASLPVILSVSCAFSISYYTPTVGLGCRSLLQLSIGLLWCFSACITLLLGRVRFPDGKYLWRMILVKDTLLATPVLLAVILVTIGIFNSCWCWSAAYSRGRANAFIALKSDAGREENSRTKYPALVFANVGLLLILVVGMRYGEGYRLRYDSGREREKRPGVIEYVRCWFKRG